MTGIAITSFEHDAEDSRGKPQAILLHITVDGRPKAVGKADLMKLVELTLREGPPATQPANTLPGFNRLPDPPAEISVNGGVL